MSIKYSVRFYKDKEVRAIWDEENSKWWFSAVNLVGIISGSDRPRKYWSDLKTKDDGVPFEEKMGNLTSTLSEQMKE